MVEDKTESELVKEGRDLVIRLGGERKSAFCKAVTHKADFFAAQQMINRLCDEVEELTRRNATQADSILEFQAEEKGTRAKFDTLCDYASHVDGCEWWGRIPRTVCNCGLADLLTPKGSEQ
jgi:hypothetical protein